MALSDQRLPLYTYVMFETQGPAFNVFNQEVFGKSYVDITLTSGITAITAANIQTPVELTVTKDTAIVTNYALCAANTFSVNRSASIITDFTIEIYELPSDVLIDFTSSFTKNIGINDLKGRTTLSYVDQFKTDTDFTLTTVSKINYSQVTSFLTGYALSSVSRIALAGSNVIVQTLPMKIGVAFTYVDDINVNKSFSFKTNAVFTLTNVASIVTAQSIRTVTQFALPKQFNASSSIAMLNPIRLAVSGNTALITSLKVTLPISLNITRTLQDTKTVGTTVTIKMSYVSTNGVFKTAYSLTNPLRFSTTSVNNIALSVGVVSTIRMNLSSNFAYRLHIEDLINEHISTSVTFNLASSVNITKNVISIKSFNQISATSAVNLIRTIKVSTPIDFAIVNIHNLNSSFVIKSDGKLNVNREYHLDFATNVHTRNKIQFTSASKIDTVTTLVRPTRFQLNKTTNLLRLIQLKVPSLITRQSHASFIADYDVTLATKVGMLSNSNFRMTAMLIKPTNVGIANETTFTNHFILKGKSLIERSSINVLNWVTDVELPALIATDNGTSAGSSISLGGAVQISFNSSFRVHVKPWRVKPKIVDITLIKNDVNVIHSKVEWKALTPVNIERL
jgi:hypothetical protein